MNSMNLEKGQRAKGKGQRANTSYELVLMIGPEHRVVGVVVPCK